MLYNLKNGFLLIFFIFILDQLTKYLALKYLWPDRVISLLPFLNLVYVENTGAAFGLFKSLGSTFFITTSIIATLFLIYLMVRDSKNWIVYSLIISGALGNVTDRLIHGYVIDFIDFHIGEFHWPAFNLADSAISIGVVFFLYRSFKK